MQKIKKQNEKERNRRSESEYKRKRYAEKAKKFKSGENTRFTYKKKDKKPGRCPYCMKLYIDR